MEITLYDLTIYHHMNDLSKKTTTLLSLLVFTILLAGCELAGEEPEETLQPSSGVYIANQGNFSDANGTITFYDPADQSVSRNIVPNLGTIIQSITLVDGRGYIMSNSANRIDVFNLDTHERIAQITGVNSPRYMAVVDENTAYVTNLFSGTVTVINTETNTVADTIAVGSNPEGIAVVDGRAYIANSGFGSGSTVSVIDTETDTVSKTVDVECDGPRFVLTDGEQEVWVFCTGKTVYNDDFSEVIKRTNGAVRILDGASGSIIARFPINGQIGTAGPGQDAFYAEEASAMFVVVEKKRVLRFDTETNTGPVEIPLPAGGPIGAVAYNAARGHLYIGRSAGFVETGAIEIYNPGDTTIVHSFEAGIAPSYIAFDK